jgi:antirestriction protein ArdC
MPFALQHTPLRADSEEQNNDTFVDTEAAMHIAAVYENVTKSIIAELERGTAPWIKPWKAGKRVGIMPANAITGHHYRGINVPILWHAADERSFPTNGWLTFKQALDAGGHVRKGEKGTQIVFAKRISVTDNDEEERQISMLRAFTVFNVSQVEGIDALLASPEALPAGTVETFVSATGADIRRGGGRACYIPSRDFIALPNPSDFTSPEHYDATKLHELVHWSGNEKRLKRDLGNRFGTKAYAAEELIAELGAAFLCAHLGVEGQLRHAEYIASWLSLLKEDDRAIFTAASKASAAADYLRSFSEKVEEDA